jgi:hypothetical protein
MKGMTPEIAGYLYALPAATATPPELNPKPDDHSETFNYLTGIRRSAGRRQRGFVV